MVLQNCAKMLDAYYPLLDMGEYLGYRGGTFSRSQGGGDEFAMRLSSVGAFVEFERFFGVGSYRLYWNGNSDNALIDLVLKKDGSTVVTYTDFRNTGFPVLTYDFTIDTPRVVSFRFEVTADAGFVNISDLHIRKL